MQVQSEGSPETAPILARSSHGMILSCLCCDRYEIRFGNAVFELPPHLLPVLARALADMEREPYDRHDPRPHLLRPTEEAPVAFAFSEAERRELQSLVADVLATGPSFVLPARVLHA